MKKSLLAASAAAILLLTLPLSACMGASAPNGEAGTAEVFTIPPITVPEEPDERTPTDLTTYTDDLNDLFAHSAPTPEENFTYEITENGAAVTGYVGGDTVVVIPDTIGGQTVTAIAKGAFADKTFIEAISVPDTVTVIEKGAFAGCKGLRSMRTPVVTCADAPYFGALFGAETFEANGYTVPAELTMLVVTDQMPPAGQEWDHPGLSIPEAAFYACRNLKVISLPSSLYEIGNFAFYNCSALAYADLASTRLKTVGLNAFTGCSALLSLALPDTAETLGFAMLEGCRSLESLTLPFVGGDRANAETAYLSYLFGASDYTFSEDYIPGSLISVTLLEGCGDIPANAFFACDAIREVRLPAGVTAIGRRAFYGCEHLVAMNLPDSVTEIGDDAFHGCVRLADFRGGANLATLGIQAFMDCVSLKTVTLPDTVTSLPNACFAGCVSLESLTADGVKSQGKQVFRHCARLGLPWVNPECVPSE